MQISENVSLHDRNSFGFDVKAEYYCSAGSVDEIREALQWQHQHQMALFVLGGGSNTVFTRNVTGLVLHICTDELSTTEVDTSFIVRAGAGINWHQLVQQTVFNGQYGLENLALIPGNTGAAPIQNIGAYGKEVCDNLVSVDVVHRQTGEFSTLTPKACNFGYRDSVFKSDVGKDFIITAIELRLSAVDEPVITYTALADAMVNTEHKATEVFRKVCELRRSKLPDPSLIGNAGSFFKNPVISCQHVDTLKKTFPDLPVFPQNDEFSKVPAAWLIDKAGWKGYRNGDVGVHQHQALVLVNYGGGNGQQIATLADQIQQDIHNRYNIRLEREPVLY